MSTNAEKHWGVTDPEAGLDEMTRADLIKEYEDESFEQLAEKSLLRDANV